jgi:hypothetical protein
MMHTYIHTHTHIHIYTDTYTHIHTYTHKYIYTDTHIHIHIDKDLAGNSAALLCQSSVSVGGLWHRS